MIAFIQGRLHELWPTHVVVQTSGGIGYEVHIPLSTYDRLPQPPAEVTLLTHLQVREDAHTLYGFLTTEERDLFRLLVGQVTGVGPKLALAILNGMAPTQFRAAVVEGDVGSIGKIKGLGKKTAERLVVELRDKVGVSAAWEAKSAMHASTPQEQAVTDAVLALVSLGYKSADASRAVRAARDAHPEAEAEKLIKEALRAV